MKAQEKQAASRRMKGRFSSRLSNRKSGGRFLSFRIIPEYYRLAVESLKEYALITMDKDLIIGGWSGPAAAMFGYTESEVIGKNISMIFTREDKAKGTLTITSFLLRRSGAGSEINDCGEAWNRASSRAR